jgi:hypothetical protein
MKRWHEIGNKMNQLNNNENTSPKRRSTLLIIFFVFLPIVFGLNAASGEVTTYNISEKIPFKVLGTTDCTSVTGKGPWNWTCSGSNSGSKASCSANLEINGVCGSAEGESLLKAPTSNLCKACKASKVTGKGPWDWTCTGSHGGNTANCSANLK